MTLIHYLFYKTLCSWCKPPKRIRGFPWARYTSHGICTKCLSKFNADVLATKQRDKS